MALPLPVNGVFRVHPDPGSNALADFCRGPSMVPAAHAPMTADAPARAGNRQSRGWSSRHARRVILERVMVSFAPAQECARIRPGIQLRHPASRPRTRTHGSMSGHNAPGTPQADTGLRTQDSGQRTGQDRTGRRLTHRHTDSGPATEQEQHIQPGSPPKQGKRQYRINSHAPDTVAARSGPQYPLSRSACPRSDRRMPLPPRSRRSGTPAGLTPFPFTPCHETRHPQGRFP